MTKETAAAKRTRWSYRCSYCRQPQQKKCRFLIRSPNRSALICERCVVACLEMLEEQEETPLNRAALSFQAIRNEIKSLVEDCSCDDDFDAGARWALTLLDESIEAKLSSRPSSWPAPLPLETQRRNSMEFAVKLIKVPKLDYMDGPQVFDLFCNATHIAGRYWIFEGDDEALLAPCEIIAEGVTPVTGDMSNDELIRHASKIFGHDFSGEPKAWEMY